MFGPCRNEIVSDGFSAKVGDIWPADSQPIWYAWTAMDFRPKLDAAAESPLYRQLYEQIAEQIRTGHLARGERLPATRELAGLLGLNRTTVSAAYELLESEGLIAGQVGRGSFVTGVPVPHGVDWTNLLQSRDHAPAPAPRAA